jgi:hypothetical protein
MSQPLLRQVSGEVRWRGGFPVAELDAGILGDEFDIGGLLMIQLIVAAVALTIGYLGRRQSGRRWARAGFVLALLLAVAACGGTLFRCSEARDTTQGRVESRIPGPHMSHEKAQNHLDWVWNRGLAGVTILALTVIGGGLLRHVARRRREGQSLPDVSSR